MRSLSITSLDRGTMSWRNLVCLAILAMLCRSAIPLGYMPDQGAVQQGKLLLTLCNGSSATVLFSLAAADNGDHPTPDEVTGSLDCPFSLFATQAVLSDLSVGAAAVPRGERRIPLLSYRSAPTRAATGPPLGSRAPPSHLA